MEPTQHQRRETSDVGPSRQRADESSVPPGDFWRERTLDELAAQQGITVPQPLDELFGAATELWDDDEDFDHFLRGIHDRRTDQGNGGEGEW